MHIFRILLSFARIYVVFKCNRTVNGFLQYQHMHFTLCTATSMESKYMTRTLNTFSIYKVKFHQFCRYLIFKINRFDSILHLWPYILCPTGDWSLGIVWLEHSNTQEFKSKCSWPFLNLPMNSISYYFSIIMLF